MIRIRPNKDLGRILFLVGFVCAMLAAPALLMADHFRLKNLKTGQRIGPFDTELGTEIKIGEDAYELFADVNQRSTFLRKAGSFSGPYYGPFTLTEGAVIKVLGETWQIVSLKTTAELLGKKTEKPEGIAVTTNAIGHVTALDGEAFAQKRGSDTQRQLKLSSAIYRLDTLTTYGDSKLRITFTDDSIMDIGELATTTLDEYFFEKANKKKIGFSAQLKRGCCRIITGQITALRPDRFAVQTRQASIGIRGCDLYIEVLPTVTRITAAALGEKEAIVVNKFPTPEMPVSTSFALKKTGERVQISPQGKVKRDRVPITVLDQYRLKTTPLKILQREYDEAHSYKGGFFKVVWEPVSWHEAKRRCYEMGGHLACVETEEKNQFLADLIGSRGIVWLGATDEVEEGKWRWVNDSAMSYNNWWKSGQKQEPDNANREEHYLAMSRGVWADWVGDPSDGKVKGFVCEWDKRVTISKVDELMKLPAAATNYMLVAIAPGTYALPQPLVFDKPLSCVTIYGETKNPGDVLIARNGITVQGLDNFSINSVTFTNLTTGISLRGSTLSPKIINCNFINLGGSALEARGSADALLGNGLVQDCVFERRDTKIKPGNMITLNHTRDWVIRGSRFLRPRTGVFAVRSEGTTVENCFFYNFNYLGIAFGHYDNRDQGWHKNGLAQNNVFYREKNVRGDAAIGCWHSPGAKVYHNTAILQGTFQWVLGYRFDTTKDVHFAWNLCDKSRYGIHRRGGSGKIEQNVLDAQTSWFVNPEKLDFRLTSEAKAAIDKATGSTKIKIDFEGQARPYGAVADIGADEFVPVPGTTVKPQPQEDNK